MARWKVRVPLTLWVEIEVETNPPGGHFDDEHAAIAVAQEMINPKDWLNGHSEGCPPIVDVTLRRWEDEYSAIRVESDDHAGGPQGPSPQGPDSSGGGNH